MRCRRSPGSFLSCSGSSRGRHPDSVSCQPDFLSGLAGVVPRVSCPAANGEQLSTDHLVVTGHVSAMPGCAGARHARPDQQRVRRAGALRTFDPRPLYLRFPPGNETIPDSADNCWKWSANSTGPPFGGRVRGCPTGGTGRCRSRRSDESVDSVRRSALRCGPIASARCFRDGRLGSARGGALRARGGVRAAVSMRGAGADLRSTPDRSPRLSG